MAPPRTTASEQPRDYGPDLATTLGIGGNEVSTEGYGADVEHDNAHSSSAAHSAAQHFEQSSGLTASSQPGLPAKTREGAQIGDDLSDLDVLLSQRTAEGKPENIESHASGNPFAPGGLYSRISSQNSPK